MAADSDIIKEFLVALGFKVDDKKLKDFTGGIDRATKFVGKLAVGLETMATVAQIAVTKVSEQFEDLYYASIRLNDSVENIRATTFEIGQLGGTAQGGLQALENLGEFFRSNPGGERFVQGLGVQTRQANGELRGMTEILKDLAPALRAMPYYRAKVVAGVLGVDPRTLQALLRDTGEASDRYHALAKRMGVDQDAAAKASKDFMNDLRELLAMITLAADKIILKLQPFVRDVVRWLEELHVATDGWSTGLIALSVVLVPLLAILDPIAVAIGAIAVGFAMVDWSRWTPEIKGLLEALGNLAGALGDLGRALAPVGKWLQDAFGPGVSDMVGRFFVKTTASINELATAIRIVVALLHGDWKKAWEEAGNLTKQELSRQTGIPLPSPANENRTTPPAAAPPSGRAAPSGDALTRGARIQAYLQKHGFEPDQARGITAGIHAESLSDPNSVNPKSGAYGIGQWLGSRKAELFRRYGNRPNLEQQLEFLLWELNGGDRGGAAVRGEKTQQGALSAYIKKFMRPAQGSETLGDLNRGMAYLSSAQAQPLANAPHGRAESGGAHVTQHTTINVNGSHDPHATAKAVSAEQARVNDAMVRNMKVAAS